MIKAILFDFDGVLTIDKTGSQSILRYLAAQTGLSEDLLRTEYYKYNKDLLYGKITHCDMWESFCESVGCQIDYNVLTESFQNTPLDKDMITLVKELKQSFLIGMITDNKVDRIDTILGFFHLRDIFDAVSVSAQCGSGKSDKLIFEETLSQLNMQPDECIFIDNTEKNLIIPKQMGFHTILFDDTNREIEVFRKELQHLLQL